MGLFWERLRFNIKKNLIMSLMALFYAIIILIICAVIFALPLVLLQFIIGDYAVVWIPLAMLLIIVWSCWKDIKGWFIWQFIEPFKK